MCSSTTLGASSSCWLEQRTHNPLVPSSTLGGPTIPQQLAAAEKDPILDSGIGSFFLVDILALRSYNTNMKKRNDRNHIIYELVVNGSSYIGVTAKTESTINKSVRARAAKHFYRAKTEAKDWLLCRALRELASKDEIEIRVHEIVRGKAAAHKREVELRRLYNPILNTDRRGD